MPRELLGLSVWTVIISVMTIKAFKWNKNKHMRSLTLILLFSPVLLSAQTKPTRSKLEV
jgi:hypothetical protein